LPIGYAPLISYCLGFALTAVLNVSFTGYKKSQIITSFTISNFQYFACGPQGTALRQRGEIYFDYAFG